MDINYFEDTDFKGVRVIYTPKDSSKKEILDFNTFKDAVNYFKPLYLNEPDDDYANEVFFPILMAAEEEIYDYIDLDDYAVIEEDPFVKSEDSAVRKEAGALKESIEYHCNKCKQVVQLDHNGQCPNCYTDYLDVIVSEVQSGNSNYYLDFIKENNNGKYVNKIDLNRPKSYIKAGERVIQVTKKFFDELTPEVHDKTPHKGYCGGVIISKEPELIQKILKALEGASEELKKPLGNVPEQPEKEVKGQLSIDDLNKSKTLNSSLQRDWKARAKLLVDNELFVDFD